MLQAERLPDQLSEDDLAFWSFVVMEQRPNSVAEAYRNSDSDSDDEEEDGVEEESDEGEDMDID